MVYIPDGVDDSSCASEEQKEKACQAFLEQNGATTTLLCPEEVSVTQLVRFKTDKKKQAMTRSEEILNKLDVEEVSFFLLG